MARIRKKREVLSVSSTKGLKNIHALNQYPQIRLILFKCKVEDRSLDELKIEYIQ